MKIQTKAKYKQLRKESPYSPAKWLFAQAKGLTANYEIELDRDLKYNGESEGFEISIRCEPDEECLHEYTSDERIVAKWISSWKGLRKGDLSLYRNDEAWRNGEPIRSSHYHTYVLPLGGGSDCYKWDVVLESYLERKIPLHTAVLLAKAEISRAMNHLDEYYSYSIFTSASKMGVELAEDCIGGIIVEPNHKTDAFLEGCIASSELVEQVVSEAKRKLLELVSSEKKGI